jgi:hypothetical protein
MACIAALVATATAAANATATRKRFAREPDVFRNGTTQRIPIGPHGVIRQMATLPWFDRGARRAKSGKCEQQKESEQFHDGDGSLPKLRREGR